MQILKIKIPEGGADLSSITLKGIGTGDEVKDVKKVRLYLDSNKNNKIDAEDEQLADGIYTQDNGKATLSLVAKKHFNAGSVQLMVGYDFN